MEPIVCGVSSSSDEAATDPDAREMRSPAHQEDVLAKVEGEAMYLRGLASSSRPVVALRTFAAADFSESFRLYFGTNVTVFPYIIFLAGTAGSVVMAAAVVFLLYVASQQLDRAKLLALASTSYDEDDKEAEQEAGSGDIDTRIRRRFQDHTAVATYMGLARALFSPMHHGQSSQVSAETALESDREPFLVFFTGCTVVLSQYCSACAFSMMLGLNVAALLNVTTSTGLFITMILLTVLLAFYSPRTAFIFAHVNNATLLGAGAIILFSIATTNSSAGDTQAAGGPLWMWPRSVADTWICLCITISYISGILFVPDAETNISSRYLSRLGLTSAGASEARSRHLVRRFEGLLMASSLVAVGALLAFGQAVFATYGERTNAVVALSLPPGVVRKTLLADLCVGVSVCSAINVAALCKLMDDSPVIQRCLSMLQLSSQQADRASQPAADGRSEPSIPRRIAVRFFLFGSAQLILILIPFFDLIMSLSGSIGLNTESFLIPPMLELQGHRRRIASLRRKKGGAGASCWRCVGWIEAFWAMPRWSKFSFVLVYVVGWSTLVTGTYTAIRQELSRL
jgi:hypothetical protein